MRNPYRKLAFVILGSATLFTSAVQADWIEDAIKGIRARYNQVEGWKTQKQTIKFEANDGPESATMTRHTFNGDTVKIDYNYSLGDHGGANVSFYYHHGHMIFAFQTESGWGFTGRQKANGESETVDTLSEYRVYYKEGNLIRLLRKSVSSTNANSLGGMIKKASNENYTDPDRAQQLSTWAIQLSQVWDVNALRNVVLQ